MSQKFCNILVMCGTIRQFWILWAGSWRWWGAKLVYYSASMAWSIASESTVWGLPDLAWLSISCNPSEISSAIWFLYYNQQHLHISHDKWFSLLSGCMAQFKFVKHKFSDYVARSSLQLSNHTRSEAMHCVSAYHLPWISTIAWTASVMWYKVSKVGDRSRGRPKGSHFKI